MKEKVIAKYLFYITSAPFPKFYLNQTSIAIKKRKKFDSKRDK